MTLYANRGRTRSIRTAFHELASGVHRLRFAAPFFSYGTFIEDLSRGGRTIHLIVRLGPVTSPEALERVMRIPTVQVRYFSSPKFHTKLYIFGDRCALIGSANLTDAGMQSNREVVVTIPADNPDFEDAVSLYESYWNESIPFTQERLALYQKVWRDGERDAAERSLERDVIEAFGEVLPSEGVQEGLARPSTEKLFMEDYERSYQVFLAAFREVESIYSERNKQKSTAVPLRIEIDQFLNFVRQEHARGDSYLSQPLLGKDERLGRVSHLLNDWFGREWPYLTDAIVPGFQRINSRLGSPDDIQSASIEDLLGALEVCHAFSEQLRYHLGGIETLRSSFRNGTTLPRLQRTLTYLLHGQAPFIERMGSVIFDESLRVPKLGRSVVQELLGWVNRESVPICNGRTLKSLRFLGYDVPTV